MSDSEGEAEFDLFGDNQPNENDQKTNVVSTLEALDPEALLSAVSEKLERVQKCQAKEEELAQAQQEISFNDTARLDATLQELEQVMVESEALTNELAATAVVVQGRIQMLQAKIASSKADRIKNLTLLRRLLQVSEQLQQFVRGEEKEDGDFNDPVVASPGCIQLDPPCSYNVTLNDSPPSFLVEGGVIPAEKLRECKGPVKVTVATNTSPPLPLGDYQVNTDGVISLPVTQVHTTWKENDSPLQTAQISGEFRGEGKDAACKVLGTTGSSGTCSLALPQGKLSKMQATKGDIKVENRGDIVVIQAQQGAKGKKIPQKMEINPGATYFHVQANTADYTVVLGDVSGSMSSGKQMEVLKTSLLRCFNDITRTNGHVAMMCWNTTSQWMQTRWLTAADQAAVSEWVQQRKPGGGNDMKAAIEDAIKRFPETTDIHTMCDGDVTPFTAQLWDAFQKQHPCIRFHFIALGKSADTVMQAMAACGRGNYTEVM